MSKLAVEKFEETGRPLRIAIDISIWQFQIQAGQGGSNPAVRTFYYRLLRLLSVTVQPLFVFDGPNKPPFKRNKRSNHHGASIPNMMCKQLLKLFGFPFHVAPGEAEAECAYLQREGVVDAVLSEDVDTLMFGSEVTFRNWSSEGTRGNKSPTHVSVYNAKATKEGKAGLDREGMILIALMSGGDYITEGIPGCGIKVACEAARAGFGKSLCRIPRADTAGLDIWRKNLVHELHTNESKFFRVKHKALTIPDSFPNKEVLGYYTHPVVSSATKIERLKDTISWDGELDIPGLRMFVAEGFDWTHKAGAKKFIRGLAPALLVHKLRLRGDRRSSGYGDIVLTAMNEMELVRAICGRRTHFSTDGIQELRVVYHPIDIVGLDLDSEEEDSEDYGRDGLAPTIGDDQIEGYISDEVGSRSTSPIKRSTVAYDPTQPDKLWIPETIAKVGVPLKVEDYEESLRNPRQSIKAKRVAKKALTKEGMPKGAMDKFVKVSKPFVGETELMSSTLPCKTTVAYTQLNIPPVYLNPTFESFTSSQPNLSILPTTAVPARTGIARGRNPTRTINESSTMASKVTVKPKEMREVGPERLRTNANPWTLARSSPTSHNGPTITKNVTKCKVPSKPSPSKRLQPHSPDLRSSPSAEQATIASRYHAQSPHNETSYHERTSSTLTHDSIINNKFSLKSSSNERSNESSPRGNRTLPSTPRTTTPVLPSLPDIGSVQVTPEPINRKHDFFSTSRMQSSSPALPPTQASLSPVQDVTGERNVISISSSPEMPRSPKVDTLRQTATRPSKTMDEDEAEERKEGPVMKKVADPKKYIMLRQSLPGGWKEADEEQVSRANRGAKLWRLSQVEVLDLTEE